jgi:hypothetical protein
MVVADDGLFVEGEEDVDLLGEVVPLRLAYADSVVSVFSLDIGVVFNVGVDVIAGPRESLGEELG